MGHAVEGELEALEGFDQSHAYVIAAAFAVEVAGGNKGAGFSEAGGDGPSVLDRIR